MPGLEMAATGAAAFSPWAAVALGGASLLESILGLIFKKKQSKDVKGFQRETTAKGRELMAHPGFDQAAIDAIFGKNFENVRAQGKNVRESTTGTLGRAGMLGTGTETGAARKNAWSNENLVTEAMRDLLITGEAKKSSDIALATQMFGAVSGADVQQQAMGQGQGPALSEMLMMAMLMGGSGKKKSAIDLGALGMGDLGWDPLKQLMERTGSSSNFGSQPLFG